MKVVGIIGSNRRGNTHVMVSSAIEALRDRAEVNVIDVGTMSYSGCDGCLSCDDQGACHFDDDMAAAIELIKEADGLVIGSPARWGLLSGELKIFIDRLNPLAVPELLAGKKAVVFAVGQSKEETEEGESVSRACESIVTFCDNAGIDVVDTICVYGCLEEGDVCKRFVDIQRCKDAALKLVNDI